MSHTERVFHTARQVRGLTREMARQAVEIYLASAAEDIIRGEEVTLPSIGRLHIVVRKNSGSLLADITAPWLGYRKPGHRVQPCLHLDDDLKARCKALYLNNPNPAPPQVKPGQHDPYPF